MLIIGGGVAGVKAALDRAGAGNKVVLVEDLPSVGGERIPQDRLITDGESFTDPDLAALKENNAIRVIDNAEVRSLVGDNGSFKAKIHRRTPRIDREKCNDCGECIKVCPIHMYDDYNESLEWRTAVDYFNSGSGNYNVYKEDMPVCQRTCPINLDIRTYVGYIADRKYAEALATIRNKLPFPLSIGRVCPHPCEFECNRGYKDEPISICFLKRYVADYEVYNDVEPPITVPEKTYPEKIAIIGGGPSGLTCAYHLALLGYAKNITVFEALPACGGMFLVGIPEYRLPKKILAKDVEFVEKHGVEIKCNVRIGKDISYDDIRKDYDAVLIAIGAHLGMNMGVGNEDAEGVFEGVKFLRDAALGNEVPNKGTAIVVGGGNVAMDVARTSWRIGFDEVNLLYRRTRKEMPASPWEVDAAEHEGIKFHFLVAPQEVVVKDGKAVGMKCQRMELGEPDDSGRRRPVPIEGSDYLLDVDIAIIAIGNGSNPLIHQTTPEIEINKWGNIVVSGEDMKTSKKGVFAGGDIVTGGATVILAMGAGRNAARAMDEYLSNGKEW